jgi:bifunctional DNA-binding transcriptional regulator/antitoxin component of YhaV-PrlF toxin-antitoxin module
MSDDADRAKSRAKPLIDFLVMVDNKNRLPLPATFAERFGIEPHGVVIFADSGSDVEFTVRVIQSSYAGASAGIFGSTEENVAYVSRERDVWDLLSEPVDAADLNDLAQQFIYAKILGDLTRHFGSFRNARMWFETRQPSLDDRTPLDVIEAGEQDAVIGLAHMITSIAPD